MPRSGPNDRGPRRAETELGPARAPLGAEEVLGDGAVAQEEEAQEPRFFEDPKKIAQTIVIVLLLVGAIYFLLPQIVGIDDGIEKLGKGDRGWLAIALGFGVLMFVAYVALFRGVVGEAVRLNWRESYEITMAGLAATRLFSAGGAGGIVLTYWALRKAGLPQRRSACRMVAFLVLLYAVYMLSLLIDGILLREGVFPGPAPAGLTIVPATIAGGVIVIFLLIALIPGDLERRLSVSEQRRWGRMARRLATVPSTMASGTRTAIAFVREPSRGGLAVLGAVGFWAANIGILWAGFKAFDAEIPIAVIVQAFFVGMVANTIPSPGGVGAVDAGMIGTFLIFDVPGVSEGTVIAAVLIYRLVAFWLPLLPGVIAFFALRKTVRRWDEERTGPSVGTDIAESLPGAAITSESKV